MILTKSLNSTMASRTLGSEKTATIDYRIGNYIGGTLGNGIQRSLRTHAGRVYLNYKWGKIMDNLLDQRD